MSPLVPLSVAIGGAVGALARWGLAEGVAAGFGRAHVPWATLLVNVAGCFLIGLIAGRSDAAPGPMPAWLIENRPLLVAGFCGALTTFSTFAFETVDLLPRRPLLGIALVAAHLILGLGAVMLGRWLAA
jgi:CrcB protein